MSLRSTICSIPAPLRASLRLATVLVPLLSLSSCDNYACVFGPGNCTGSGGGGGGTTQAASSPSVGSWIVDGPPGFVDYAPRGSRAHPETVVTLEFNESLAASSLQDSFELFDAIFSVSIPLINPPPLVGDGRVVVLVPLISLTPDRSYLIRMRDTAHVTDLTGLSLARPSDGNFGNFVVPEEPPEDPTVISSWPPPNSVDQSDVGEIVVFFSRKMTPSSFGPASWVVNVDGVPPANDPNPVPLLITGGQVAITVPQVWRWRSIDAAGEPVSLGAGGEVELALSPENAPLTADTGGTLEPTTIAYTLAPIAVPVAVRKHPLSAPVDAIGEPNLSGALPVLEVELAEAAEVGDVLSLWIFGNGPVQGDPLQALLRTISTTEAATLIEILPAELDLLSSSLPVTGRLANGDLSIAVRHERGGVATAVQVVDGDPVAEGHQLLLFDVTAPVLEGLGAEGSALDVYQSSQRGVVLSGRASESIRRAEVRLPNLGFDNGTEPGTASSDADGFFIARPVVDATGEPLGIVEGNIAFSMQIYDQALNPAAIPATGTFRQLGALGPGALVPGDPIAVHVFDAVTLQPLAGALVLSQRESGTVTTLGSQHSNAAGDATVPSPLSGRSVITVALDGHDIVTFHGVRAQRIQIPLMTSFAPARTVGSIRAKLPAADISTFTNYLGDSRLDPAANHLLAVGMCTPDPITFTLDCPFGPLIVRPGLVGAQSFLGADYDITFGTFSAAGFLKGFALRLPLRPLDGGEVDTGLYQLEDLLAALPSAEQAVALDPHVLNEPPRVHPDGFGTVDGGPILTIEGISPGVPGAVPVGLGAAFDLAQGSWSILGAYAGAARGGDDPLVHGSLVVRGTLEPDLFLRAELLDEDANRAGRRPRFSQTTGILDAPDLPLLRSPSGASVAPPFDLVFDQVILDTDSASTSGLYRATLTDSAGRHWFLWRTDELDGDDTLTMHVPDLGPDGLSNGLMSGQLSAWTWPDFDPTAFLWSDIEREYDLFAHAVPVTFTQL